MARAGRNRYATKVSEASFIQTKVLQRGVLARINCPSVGQREAPIIEQELTAAAKNAANRVILDMATVTVLGSMGLGMLVTITKRCRDGGGKLAIFGLAPALKASRPELATVSSRDRGNSPGPDVIEATAK